MSRRGFQLSQPLYIKRRQKPFFHPPVPLLLLSCVSEPMRARLSIRTTGRWNAAPARPAEPSVRFAQVGEGNRTQLQRPQFTVKPWAEALCFVVRLLLRLLLAGTKPPPPVCAVCYFLSPTSTVAPGGWLPSRLWSSGVGSTARATKMWPSPTWRPLSGTDWLFVRLYTSTDRTWCK